MCYLSQINFPLDDSPMDYDKMCVDVVSDFPEFLDKSKLQYSCKSFHFLSMLRWSFFFNKLSVVKQRTQKWKKKTFRDGSVEGDKKVSFSSVDSFSKLLQNTPDSYGSNCLSSTKNLKEGKPISTEKKDSSINKCTHPLWFSMNHHSPDRQLRVCSHHNSQDIVHSPTERNRNESPTKLSFSDDELPQNTSIHSSRRRLSLSTSDPVDPLDFEISRGTCLISESLKRNEQKRRSFYTEQRYQPSLTSQKRTFNGQRVSITGLLSLLPQHDFENKFHKILANQTDIDDSWLNNMGIGYTCRKGLKPESPNQDDFFIFLMDGWSLYGVFDGHGPYGHDISNFVQKRLPCLIYENACFKTNPKQALRFSFIMVQKLLEVETGCRNKFSCTLSGCTATVVLHCKVENKLYIAHVGDSRCVLGRYTNGEVVALDLTTDHKPDNEVERKRILEAGGHIRKVKDDIPYRVFVKGKRFPGLAISRALGDTAGVEAGITCEPEIREYTLNRQTDTFMLLCSDGVWEFLSSKFVVELVYQNGNKAAQLSADMIARESWKRWIAEGNVVDDITVEVVHF